MIARLILYADLTHLDINKNKSLIVTGTSTYFLALCTLVLIFASIFITHIDLVTRENTKQSCAASRSRALPSFYRINQRYMESKAK